MKISRLFLSATMLLLISLSVIAHTQKKGIVRVVGSTMDPTFANKGYLNNPNRQSVVSQACPHIELEDFFFAFMPSLGARHYGDKIYEFHFGWKNTSKTDVTALKVVFVTYDAFKTKMNEETITIPNDLERSSKDKLKDNRKALPPQETFNGIYRYDTKTHIVTVTAYVSAVVLGDGTVWNAPTKTNKWANTFPDSSNSTVKKEASTKTDRSIDDLEPGFRAKVQRWLKKCEEKNIHLFISETFRSRELQEQAYRKGRDKNGKIINNSDIVTKARPGRSPHEYGVAIDVYPRDKDGKPDMHFDIKNAQHTPQMEIMKQVAAIAQAEGINWGGNFKSLIDFPHFQDADADKQWQVLRTKYPNGWQPQ